MNMQAPLVVSKVGQNARPFILPQYLKHQHITFESVYRSHMEMLTLDYFGDTYCDYWEVSNGGLFLTPVQSDRDKITVNINDDLKGTVALFDLGLIATLKAYASLYEHTRESIYHDLYRNVEAWVKTREEHEIVLRVVKILDKEDSK